MRKMMWLLLMVPVLDAHAGARVLDADDAQLRVRAVDAQDAKSGTLLVDVRLDGKPVLLQLAPMLRLEREFAPFAPAIARGEDRLYAGSVAGLPGSWVRMSLVGGGWIGAVFDARTLWYLEPAARHPELAASRAIAANATLVYQGDDLDLAQGYDLGGRLPPAIATLGAALDDTPAAPAGAPRYLKLTLVLDTEFQALYGGSSASTAGAILNIADGLYRAQTDVQISLHHLRALATNGTLTSTAASPLLDAFTAFMPGSGIPFAGLAHLLSGKDFDGSTVGLAWVGTVCSTTFGYGIDQVTFSTANSGSILAHEIGHNFDADHDSQGNACPARGFVMAAVLNLGSPPSAFSSCSLGYFNGFLAGNPACLVAPPTPSDVLFRNGFEP